MPIYNIHNIILFLINNKVYTVLVNINGTLSFFAISLELTDTKFI